MRSLQGRWSFSEWWWSSWKRGSGREQTLPSQRACSHETESCEVPLEGSSPSCKTRRGWARVLYIDIHSLYSTGIDLATSFLSSSIASYSLQQSSLWVIVFCCGWEHSYNQEQHSKPRLHLQRTCDVCFLGKRGGARSAKQLDISLIIR